MSQRIQSFVRIRPYLKSQDKSESIVELSSNLSTSSLCLDGQLYKFDKVFNQDQTNFDLYSASLKSFIADALESCVNTTVFAYGQTCSGKTHTIFGHKQQEKGIIYSAFEDLFGKTQVKASVGFYEIYNEEVNDLLNPKSEVQIREINGSFVLSGLTEQRISSANEAMEYLRIGNENKVMGSSNLHDKSSRSHCIFRMHLAIQYRGLCEINFVDLAGSELLSDNFGSQQQKETKNINMSLFNLKNVIFSLSENQPFIPYRNSTLTKLLQNSLGGNSQTAIFNMVSPDLSQLAHSKRTLSFGQTASKIVNNLLINKSIFKKESDVVQEKVKIKEEALKPQSKATAQLNEDLIVTFRALDNQIQLYGYGPSDVPNLALVLPPYGSKGRQYMGYLYNDLISKGFFVVSMDYPGQNESSGQKFNLRGHDESVPFLNKIISIERFQPYRNIALFGYDYGASLAMNFGTLQGTRVKQIFSFHPAWSQDLAVLKSVRVPVVLLWVPAEQLHPIAQGEKMNKIIPKCKLIKLDCGKFNADKPKKAYKCIGEQISAQIMLNLRVQDFLQDFKQEIIELKQPINEKESIISKKEQNCEEQPTVEYDLDEILNKKDDYLYYKMNLKGACLRREFASQNASEQIRNESPPPNIDKMPETEKWRWAVSQFKELLLSNRIQSYYADYLSSGPLRTRAIQLFSNLPTLLPNNQNLEKFQVIWGAENLPKNLSLLQNFPRYLPGRQVHVNAKVSTRPFNEDFLDPCSAGENCITHKAFIDSYDELNKEFRVSLSDNKRIQVKDAEIYRLNSPTNFTGDPVEGGLLFEDGIKCKYGDLLTKAKLIEAAFSISDIVGSINFSTCFESPANNQDPVSINLNNLSFQQKCVERITKCIDLIHLVHEGIHPTRFTAFTCGKLAYFGQGNCHTLASVDSAFLLPFCEVLGIEVKFRAGSILKTNREINDAGEPLGKWDGRINHRVEDHTWVELTYQPSQQSVVLDTSCYINSMDINQAYARYMHISDRAQCNSKPPKIPKNVSSASFKVPCRIKESFDKRCPFGQKSDFPNFSWQDILRSADCK